LPAGNIKVNPSNRNKCDSNYPIGI
jgi:hypothetical protein